MAMGQGKTALVTGASYGIGRAVAEGLGRAGFKVVLTARSEEQLRETARRVSDLGSTAFIIPADLSSDLDRERLFHKLSSQVSSLSVVVHAASGRTDPDLDSDLLTTEDSTIKSLVGTTFEGTVFLVKNLIPLLERGAPSNLILISSDWALRGSHGPSVFSSAKAAVAHFGHTIRRSLAGRGISTTVLYPGDVATFDAEWKEPKWNLSDSLEDVRSELGTTRIPLADIVDAIFFVLDRQMARVEELSLVPLNPDYDY